MLDMISYCTSGSMIILVLIMVYLKDFYQRLICMNMFGSLGVLFIVTLGSYEYNESFVDIAIIYLLLSYVVNMAILRV